MDLKERTADCLLQGYRLAEALVRNVLEEVPNCFPDANSCDAGECGGKISTLSCVCVDVRCLRLWVCSRVFVYFYVKVWVSVVWECACVCLSVCCLRLWVCLCMCLCVCVCLCVSLHVWHPWVCLCVCLCTHMCFQLWGPRQGHLWEEKGGLNHASLSVTAATHSCLGPHRHSIWTTSREGTPISSWGKGFGRRRPRHLQKIKDYASLCDILMR